MTGAGLASAEAVDGHAGASVEQARSLAASTEVRPQRPGYVVAIGGGKGGIGKSLIASNLGVHLAQNGCRVVLLDADLGGANLHTCLGMQAPTRTLSDFVGRRVAKLEDVVCETPVPGLGLISGALDSLEAANPKYSQKLRLLREVSRLNVDYVLIDLGGGTGFNVLDFFLIADQGVLAVVPEPTSIENAYRFIKAAYYRRLKTIEGAPELKALVEQALAERQEKALKTPVDLFDYVTERSSEAGAKLGAELARSPMGLIVNQARSPEEHRLGNSISDAARKYFGIPMRFLGAIPYDDAVWRAVRRRRPLISESPASNATAAIRHIAQGLVRSSYESPSRTFEVPVRAAQTQRQRPAAFGYSASRLEAGKMSLQRENE